jgi:hypothetical protein
MAKRPIKNTPEQDENNRKWEALGPTYPPGEEWPHLPQEILDLPEYSGWKLTVDGEQQIFNGEQWVAIQEGHPLWKDLSLDEDEG